jgi:hypothetical protein
MKRGFNTKQLHIELLQEWKALIEAEKQRIVQEKVDRRNRVIDDILHERRNKIDSILNEGE